MSAEQRAKEADELAALAMASLRAFLEGKASLQISPACPAHPTIIRFVMDAGK